MKAMNPMLIVTPTYNERENVPRLVDMVLGLHPDVDYLFVDDNSPDGTGQMLDEIAAREPRVHVLHRAEKPVPLRQAWSRPAAYMPLIWRSIG